ncbi:BES1-interacting Myc-like protein 2 [Hibiscus trionum]|uniref:BES1-interacting Myc-like protein 2 n=1 Tax=Hibiscus trionum TaxID=183268 RepID=A0A9W7IR17_HIBTR|nr:BES1-interacting Myc-like protein 2 [Hibiscus trionum]
MVKSVATAQLHQEEEDDDGETVKVEGEGSEQKTNTNRSKHSETEQRRRSKINERFQTLRDIIPQNDQKRDKASLLLEVIEYIQFLQEKLQMYEGSYQGWSQEPTKMIPWRNHHGVAENFIDHSQTMKNGYSCENDGVSPSIAASMQDSIESDLGDASVFKARFIPSMVANMQESDLGDASVFKALDHPPASATSMVNMQTQSNAIATHGRGSIAFHESASDSENMVHQPQFQLWQSRDCLTESVIPNNSAFEQDLTIRDESVGLSSAYSQGILSSLTQALQSSGVDMSQASISVKIDVGKRVASGVTSRPSSSKEKEIQYVSNQVMAQTGVRSCSEESDQAYKRHRTGKC